MTHNGAKRHPQKTPIFVAGRSTLTDAERAGAVWVEVCDDETRTTYTAKIDDVWAHGFAVHRGYGDQVALALDRWGVNGRPAAAAYESNQAIKAAQPSLFGGMG